MPDHNTQITADNRTRRGYYSGFSLISHRKEEPILDLSFLDPQSQTTTEGQAMLTSRLILNPGHMKRLYQPIGKDGRRYENNVGKIGLSPTQM